MSAQIEDAGVWWFANRSWQVARITHTTQDGSATHQWHLIESRTGLNATVTRRGGDVQPDRDEQIADLTLADNPDGWAGYMPSDVSHGALLFAGGQAYRVVQWDVDVKAGRVQMMAVPAHDFGHVDWLRVEFAKSRHYPDLAVKHALLRELAHATTGPTLSFTIPLAPNANVEIEDFALRTIR